MLDFKSISHIYSLVLKSKISKLFIDDSFCNRVLLNCIIVFLCRMKNPTCKYNKYSNTGGSRTAAASKMGRFVIIVNGWKPLTIITKRFILDVAAVLDLPLLKDDTIPNHLTDIFSNSQESTQDIFLFLVTFTISRSETLPKTDSILITSLVKKFWERLFFRMPLHWLLRNVYNWNQKGCFKIF